MTTTSIGTRPPSAQADAHRLRLGCVSYLNTLPLIEGLGVMEGLELVPAPPADLIAKLTSREVDAALVSLIDYQRSDEPLTLIPVGMIASPDQTHTVRLFSRTPIEKIGTLCCDAESHTSVVLARIILAERFGAVPEIRTIEWGSASDEGCDGVLLIGDKVASGARSLNENDYPHQLDLGSAWREMTGLAFVYAMWMCRREDAGGDAIARLAAVLDRTRRHNRTRMGWIASTHGASHQWDTDEARRYLRELLAFDVDDEARRGVERFFDLARHHGLIDTRRDTRWLGD